MTNLTPDQLPTSNAQFIAYGTPERIADPFGGDDPISIRPQVFVRYYRGIKIKDLRTPHDDTVNLVLDPESVGLQKEFGAYMNSDDPLVAYLREQHEAGAPIDIGLEYVRNKKAKDSKALISPVIPIHALRGANSPDGSGDNSTMMGAAGNHVSSKVAMVNGRRSTVSQSDPREWQILSSNRKGDLPPEGWKALTDRDDWTKVGAITPKGDSVPAPQQAATQQSAPDQGAASGLDANTLAKIVHTQVRMALKDYGESLREEEAATRGNPTSKQANGTAEGKPWNIRVNKDHLNLGSYLVTGEGHALRWAYRYLGERDDEGIVADEEIHWAAAQELADASQRIADRVQSAAYNGEVRANRVSASFNEATRWVRFQIEERYPFETSEDFDYDTWFNEVGQAATQGLKQAETNADTFLAESYPQAEKQTQQAPRQQGTDEDRGPVVDAFLQMLTRKWTDADGLRALAGEAKSKGLLNELVWAEPREGKFATEQFEGAQEYTIADLTKRQYGCLTQAAQAPQQESATEAPEPEAAPAPKDEGAPEPQQAQQEPSPSEAPAAPSSDRTAQHVAADLARATTDEQVAAAYGEARERNFLTVEIAVKQGEGAFGLSPVSPTTEGAENMSLGAVFDAIRTGMEAQGTESAPAEPQLTPEPESAPEPQPAAEEPPTPEGSSPEQDIAQRALDATTAEEIKALFEEAQAAGVENSTVSLRGGSGALAAFLKSRSKRVGSNA